MAGAHAFTELHRGLPLMSRAVLVTRLRELQQQGIVERRPHADGTGHAYWLTPAGEEFRPAVRALGQWGLAHMADRIEASDLDPALLMWGLHARVDPAVLPGRPVVLRFEFSGVPANRTKFRVMWLVLKPSGADVCAKDPGLAVDLTLRGDIRDWVAVYLGHATWPDATRAALRLDGDAEIAGQMPVWIRFDAVGGGGADPRR
jgi:DNA-binding MarR family transcriptional regulator